MKDGEIFLVFPRSTPFAYIKDIADTIHAEIYKVRTEVSYKILGVNEYYDHSPQISL